MTLDEIKALIDAMAASDLAEMEVAKDGWTLRLARQIHRARSADDPASRPASGAPAFPVTAACAADVPSPVPGAPAADEVRAPLAGLAYLSPAPEAPPYVALGQAVEAGALLCTVEAMKTFHEVRAPRAGSIAAVLIASGDEVEGGQPLLRLT
ncbi:acetyl-CoA carboxylase biotin carboxyl carrier protein [Methylobacterium nonmethylotrophicum]|uniref:Biotin carboxyl carrier protein of acetyl-CoA carboxylase n=1 Tax=Methylobacterium nonmethylotrophicum TaxID=1141884 RepID=A0A4Z0NT89_9HYPH|nr:biotin/lipoyl-containing protein [Methylobacterium nonmethylotrophicum]TGD99675.1 acetyl-CoA carboxylase biotin carboxyl carrier protein subunit [Methylobacterium nonmethylotrophicum]